MSSTGRSSSEGLFAKSFCAVDMEVQKKMTLNSQLQGNADITDSDIPGPFNRHSASKKMKFVRPSRCQGLIVF